MGPIRIYYKHLSKAERESWQGHRQSKKGVAVGRIFGTLDFGILAFFFCSYSWFLFTFHCCLELPDFWLVNWYLI